MRGGGILALGRQIYDTKNWREMHRLLVFLGRSSIHYPTVKNLIAWFETDATRRMLLTANPFPIEQATRAFFYAGSTLGERVRLIRDHFDLLFALFPPDWAVRLGRFDAHYTVWRSAQADFDWYAELTFEPGQRKEGLLSLKMMLGKDALYQIMFWLAKDKKEESSLFIGAMQGPNMENAKDVVKETTKLAHRYRTKNLILYMVRAVARTMKLKHIYAVSNEGYYANNHMRRDRKLKTDFGAFWEEAGGHVTDDPRFYELPLVEARKTMEEVPTRKRAVYRRRFAFLDDVDAQIVENMESILK